MNEASLYGLLYISRLQIAGGPAEVTAAVDGILAGSRRRNAARGLSGALLATGTHFAQALEGELGDVSEVFESIQRDTRHTDIIVLQAAPLARRAFADWAMGFAATDEELTLPEAPGEAAREMLARLCRLVGRETDGTVPTPS